MAFANFSRLFRERRDPFQLGDRDLLMRRDLLAISKDRCVELLQ